MNNWMTTFLIVGHNFYHTIAEMMLSFAFLKGAIEKTTLVIFSLVIMAIDS